MYIPGKSTLKLVNLQSLVACKVGKFFILLYCVRKLLYRILTENHGSNFRTQYKSIQNLPTLQGYIFRILQTFRNQTLQFTNFSMLFLALVNYLHLLA